MTQYILSVHIGPMQVFIKAARRTRDLWYGSWLISELSKAVARSVAEQEGEKALIFPAVPLADLQPDTDINVTNKVVALVNKDPTSVAEKARADMHGRLDSLLSKIKEDLFKRITAEQFDLDRMEKQIRDLPEFYWVALPLAKDENYADVRLKVEGLLAARKNCRQFNPVDAWASSKPKSSLSGTLESVINEENYPTPDDGDEVREEKIKALYDRFRARGAERLSGVDMLKRLGKLKDEDSFPSTSHMSTIPLRQRLENANGEVKKRWQAYVKELKPEIARREVLPKTTDTHRIFGSIDGSLLFESRLRDYYEKKVPAAVKTKLNWFYRLEEVSEPIPYYAILKGDGDNMGKTLNELETAEDHHSFSQKLTGFARDVRKIVEEEYQGALIYAGGDDVLALLPLHTAVACAKKIADHFVENMKCLEGKVKKLPTFSAGIGIMHHLEPLEDALELARAAEQLAKSVEGKNALAISLDKRSGVNRTVVDTWEELTPRLNELVGFYVAGKLPHGLPYQLQAMVQSLGGEMAVQTGHILGQNGALIAPEEVEKNREMLKKIVQKEAVRIVKRKQGESDEAVKAYLESKLELLGKNGRTVTRFLNELIIANHFAKAKVQSEPLKKEAAHG